MLYRHRALPPPLHTKHPVLSTLPNLGRVLPTRYKALPIRHHLLLVLPYLLWPLAMHPFTVCCRETRGRDQSMYQKEKLPVG